jgi:hypothetical protein
VNRRLCDFHKIKNNFFLSVKLKFLIFIMVCVCAQFRETLRIDCCSSALSLTLKGVGVSPVLTLSVTDALMDFGYLLAGDYKEQAFTVN